MQQNENDMAENKFRYKRIRQTSSISLICSLVYVALCFGWSAWIAVWVLYETTWQSLAIFFVVTLMPLGLLNFIIMGNCKSSLRLLVSATALMLSVGLSWIPWHPRQRFVHDVSSIPLGSDKRSVLRTMKKYFLTSRSSHIDKTNPSYPQERATESICFLWNKTDWRYNADMAVFVFRNHKLVCRDISGD